MKKILLSLSAIGMIAVVAVAATGAFFTDTETSTGNTFTAGTLVIDDASETWMLPATFSNLKPGDRVRKWVVLKNEGSLDVGFLKVTAKNKTDSSPSFLDKMVISATGRVGSASPAYFTDDWAAVKPTVNSWMTDADMLDVSFYNTPAGVIHPGESYTMTFDFIVPDDLGNDYQNASASFDMEFYAEQIH